MASIATLLKRSSVSFGRKGSTKSDGLDAIKMTTLLQPGIHENIKISISGKIFFTTQLSKTFYICTVECVDIMCNTRNVDIIVKGENKVIFFKDYVKKNEIIELKKDIVLGGSVEILRDDFKTPVLHAIYINQISLKTKELYNEEEEIIPKIDANNRNETDNLKNRVDEIKYSASSNKVNRNIHASSFLSSKIIKNNNTARSTNNNNYNKNSSNQKIKSSSSHWKPKKNERRAAKFVNFLVEEFGYDYLKTGLILDIAGGKGEVAFESSIKRGLQTVVVDPRPIKTTKKQVQQLKFRLESQLKLVDGLKISPLARFLYHKRYATKEIDNIQGWFYEDFATIDESEIELVEKASILIGMHPDSATDAIMKVAIRFSKPFAIVPCCVFPTQFPKRRLPNGQPVQTYDDFCEYISNILGGGSSDGTENKIQESELDFEGRNKVFFYHGPNGKYKQ